MEIEKYSDHVSKVLRKGYPSDDLIKTLEDLLEAELLRVMYEQHVQMIESEPLFKFENVFFCYSWNKNLLAASATVTMNYFLLTYNPVFLRHMYKSFTTNSKINELTLSFVETKKVESYLKQEGLSWLTSRVLFYHEHAHLVQFSDKYCESLLEQSSELETYDEVSHYLETDADIYAAYCVASHVITNLLPNKDEDVNPEEVQEMMLLVVASSFALIVSISSNIRSFYTKKSRHPHPTIRSLVIIDAMIEYFKKFIKEYLKGYRFNEVKFRELSIDIAQGMIEILYPDNLNLKLKLDYKNHFKEILSYHNELITGISDLDKSAVTERNLRIRNIKSENDLKTA